MKKNRFSEKRRAPNRKPNAQKSGYSIRGLHYDPRFVTPQQRAEILSWLSTLFPIWERRYSKHNPPPSGETQRELLRPVYWLGNWQFACLNYYHPPKGILNRCVKAEPFPPVLKKMVEQIEELVRKKFLAIDIPKNWHLNTCLINFYGSRIEAGKRIDTARVGEHKDFEPGPVASISLGERALFQFVTSKRRGSRDAVVLNQWLDDGSLQIFGSDRWKNQVFHRVQRVDKRAGFTFKLNVSDFETRRINFTFRYVPDPHVISYRELPKELAEDVLEYMRQLAKNSPFFAEELASSGNSQD